MAVTPLPPVEGAAPSGTPPPDAEWAGTPSQPDRVLTPPPPSQSVVTRERSGASVGALILIALGFFFLAANLYPALTGSALFLGLGAAFAVGRVTSGKYGLAVPAGILLGFGSFVALEQAQQLPGDDGPWFFILLGLGFLLIYVLGAKPELVWPLFPSVVLAGFGALLMGVVAIPPLAQYAWVANFWPLALVFIGLWLLVRDMVPRAIRGAVGALVTTAVVLYGVVAVLVLASAASPASDGVQPFGPGWRPFAFIEDGFPGPTPPYAETVTLSALVGPTEALRVINRSGRTTVTAGTDGQVRVTATKHLWRQDQPLDVQLTPRDGVLTLEAIDSSADVLARPYADYVVEVPASIRTSLSSSSGAVQASGLAGPVDVITTSGRVSLERLAGPVTARTSSGSIRVTGIQGDLVTSSTSGSVTGTAIERLREASTSSGSVRLSGVFRDDARVNSTSGSVRLTFDRGSAVRIEARTSSGSIDARGVVLSDRQQDRHTLSGTVGGGAGWLAVETSSGSIDLSGP